MTKSADPHGQQAVSGKREDEVPWHKDWRWMTAILFLLLISIFFLWPQNEKEESEAEKPVVTTPVVILKPVPTGCNVTDSMQTFCSSNAQVIRIIEAGDLLLLNPGTTHICTKKPIVNITYKVAMNDRLRFTSALDLENTRCDIFVVTRVPR